ncbi:polymer-forming cytoskeletal protein [Leptolyngbya sp. 7M]|uniref:bactofilin family protein n=1 Tax=Leptolyngbya sp. 7M TaxID=2812896 RepID=UPI001B8D396A|nr:polymer-forming cytoskeletal protein [Leptolyngbya sp. 7M]QYO66003.1 polymer-forming cytoskeletal protein [Leptolyngbya sp. 7M]
MGNKSKTDISDAPDLQSASPAQPAQPSSYGYGNDAPSTVSKPTTDSENIARDIKEGKLSGFVGHGTSLTGDTNFQMMLRVDGHLTGTVSSDGGTLIVGNNGQLDANVSVGVANVNGVINGDVVASEKVHLGRTAKLIGNITTPKLIIEEGAIFEGGCTMLKARADQEKTTAASSSPSSYGSSSTSTASSTSGSSSYSGSSTSTAASSTTSSSSTKDENKAKTETAKV